MYRDAELLSAYIDNEVTDAERASIEARLERDEHLKEELHRYKRLHSALHELAEPDCEPSRHRCWQAIQTRARRQPGFWHRRVSVPTPVAAALAAVMVLALGAATLFSGILGGSPETASDPRDELNIAAGADMPMGSRSRAGSLEDVLRELRLEDSDEPVTISLPVGHHFELNGNPIALRARDVSWSGRQ